MTYNYYQKGFTLVELIIMIIIIGILAVAASANFVDFKKSANKAACLENQMALETAQQVFYINEYMSPSGTARYANDLTELRPFLKFSANCPSGGTYVPELSGEVHCTFLDHVH